MNSMLDRTNSMQPAKRLTLKSLISVAPRSSSQVLFEKAHSKLRDATFAVFRNKPIPYTLEELYRDVEDLCANKMIPALYDTLESLFTIYVNELLPIFMDEGLQLQKASQVWELYCKKMLMIRNIFLFMDRQLPSFNPKYLSLWDLALNLFREHILTHSSVQQKILRQLLDQIYQERSEMTVDRQLLRSIVRMHVDLQLYQTDLQGPVIRQTQQFYAEEAERLSKQLSTAAYLEYVTRRINEEENRLVAYLNGSSTTRAQLLASLETELISKQMEHLLSTGLNLIRDRRLSDLRLFYTLLSRVPGGVDQLRAKFRTYVKMVGSEIVENKSGLSDKDKVMIQSLIDCRDALLELITAGFCGDSSFHKALQEAFKEFINSRPNKPAEYLAKYLDAHLRTGNKTQTDDELERVMDKAMILFRLIDGKDIFEAFYTKELAKRLLLGKSASVDAEKAMLSKLKQECGPNYTRKMETMFQDIEVSRQLSKTFRASLQPSNSIDFNVNVISPASWPQYPQLAANYPATSPGVRKELQVSEFQALVLLQFNGPVDAPISYASLIEFTGIEKIQLDRTLLSLAVGKGQKVLIMKPLSIEMAPDHQFTFNTQFRHRLTRIKFNQIQLKETKQEQEETEERVFADRVAHVDCCIVRIMKTRKKVDHNALLTEVFKQLQFPLKASDVKKRIETLIEREYMRRDPENTGVYHYMA